MIRAFTLSLGQLFDPAILKVLAKVIALTLALFIGLGIALWWAAYTLAIHYGWAAEASGWAAAAAVMVALIAGWLLFRVVAIAVMGIFADAVVEAVERRYYPGAMASAKAPGLARSVHMGLASAGRALLFNLIALPVYLALLVTGVGTVAVFAVVNALLLGRDLGEMVAVRHLPAAAIREWLGMTRASRFLLGLVVTGLFVVPVANLFAPILGAAMATHLFHGRKS
ncbi:EI24 domain-containing protein [Sphingomonas sp. LaA6.9]|nr:EI24 domain-containing protein [Sphingomonas sp. LaA6.9]MCJ8159030.1 EI24 domain-containing protein [Sphingomonas sp. LaA6.9]